MKNGVIQTIQMPQVNSFHFQIKYTETDRKSHFHEIELHTHNEFELYINLAGKVSFLVEDSLYPLSRGDVIIARPGEHHHCVYRDDSPHKLFWILFDCQANGHFWDFLKDNFLANFISPQGELREELIAHCVSLHSGTLTQEENLYTLLRMFSILKISSDLNTLHKSKLPHDLSVIVEYITSHISEELTVSDIADAHFISNSTLERRFKETFHITPLEFIKRKKLIYAADLLKTGETVLNAGTSVGYKDNSYFIELFKHYYGITPYQYKKQLNR